LYEITNWNKPLKEEEKSEDYEQNLSLYSLNPKKIHHNEPEIEFKKISKSTEKININMKTNMKFSKSSTFL